MTPGHDDPSVDEDDGGCLFAIRDLATVFGHDLHKYCKWSFEHREAIIKEFAKERK